MHLIRRAVRGAAVLAGFAAATACENEIPTATGSDLFPGGETPTTLVAEFGGAELLLREEVYEGFGDPRLTPFLLLAHQFDGALDARPIVRFSELPDSVSYTREGSSRREEVSSYAGGRLLVPVDSLATTPRQTTRILLHELTQPWDSASVDWEYAVDTEAEQVPWTTPGGALGRLLDDEFWIPNDTTQRDTVSLQIDSATVDRIRAGEHPGLVLLVERPGTRMKLSGLTLVADARPAGNPDTLVEVRTMEGVQQFLFTAGPAEDPEVLEAGGLRGNRSILTLDLEQEVEACPEDGGACQVMPLRRVTVNRAQLVFEPVAVPAGHRPVASPNVQLRRISEPQLGRYAPLGGLIASDTIHPSAFAEGTDREYTLDVSATVLQLLAQQRQAIADGEPFDPRVSVALLATYEVPDLGLLRFRRSPRLRVTYTLPLNPSLP